MTTAPINIFQKLMRKWEAVHPYNAVHAMRIKGEPDRAAFERAWTGALAATGLGRLSLDGSRYRFENLNGDAAAFGISYPAALLTNHLTSELNRPFAEPGEPPFRPFIIPGNGEFFAGVAYQHWVADATSVSLLLREWFVRVYDPSAARSIPLKLPATGYWHTVGPHRGGWRVSESTLAMIRRHTRLRRAQKIDSKALSNHQTQFQIFPASDGLLNRLRDFAKTHHVKVNDLFLAALAEACWKHVPLQRRHNRADVAVGSIVDLRQYCPLDLSETFGVFLGFSNVVCHPEELGDFNRLLRVISSQTKLQKATGVAPSSLIWMSAAMTIGKLSRSDELYHFYRKELPLAGGVSNMALTRSWAARYQPAPLLEYIRASPTGPMTPLVVTTTTLGEKFHLGLTHRVGLIPPERAASIGHALVQRLASLKLDTVPKN